MKKLLVALPVVAGTAWAGTSYFAGVQSESVYDQIMSQTESMKPFVFEKESFEKGLTTSQAVTLVKESASPDADVLLRLQHEINHSSVQMDESGPAVGTATIRTTLVENSVNPDYQHLVNYFKGDEPLEIITKAGISGNLSNTITVSASEIPVKDGTEMLSIAESVFNITSDKARSEGEGTIGALTLKDSEGNSMATTPSQLSFNMANQRASLSAYDFLLSTDEFTVESPDFEEPLKATGLELALNSTLNSDDISYAGKFDINQIELGSAAPGDTAPITSGTLNFAVNNLKVQALAEIDAYLAQYSLTERTELSENLDSELLKEYAKVVTKNSEIMYDLALENTAGKANADFTLRFIGDGSDSGRDNIVTGIDLGNALEADVNVIADKAALEITPAILLMQSPPAQIAFVDNGDQYVAKLTVRQLVADLNGQLFPLAELSGGMLEIPLEQLLEMGGGF